MGRFGDAVATLDPFLGGSGKLPSRWAVHMYVRIHWLTGNLYQVSFCTIGACFGDDGDDKYAFQHKLGACDGSLCLPSRPTRCSSCCGSRVQGCFYTFSTCTNTLQHEIWLTSPKRVSTHLVRVPTHCSR